MKNELSLKECYEYIMRNYPDGWTANSLICDSMRLVRDISNDIFDNPTDKFNEEILKNICETAIDDFVSDIGICGCGYPNLTYEAIRCYLNVLDCENYEQKKLSMSTLFNEKIHFGTLYGLYQFLAYVLDQHDFTAHGSSIGGAWLTEKGHVFKTILNYSKQLGVISDD